jgi:hypothetical protein
MEIVCYFYQRYIFHHVHLLLDSTSTCVGAMYEMAGILVNPKLCL